MLLLLGMNSLLCRDIKCKLKSLERVKFMLCKSWLIGNPEEVAEGAYY